MYSSPRHLTKSIRQKISRPCVSKSNLETSRIYSKTNLRRPRKYQPRTFHTITECAAYQDICIFLISVLLFASKTIPSAPSERTPESAESRPTVLSRQVSMEPSTCKTLSRHQTFKDSRLHPLILGHNFCRPGFTRSSYHHAALPLIGTHLLGSIITIA